VEYVYNKTDKAWDELKNQKNKKGLQ